MVNFVLLAIYHNRTYPRTMLVGIHVGNMSFSQVAQKAASQHVVPGTLTLSHGTQTVSVPSSDLGVQFDAARTQTSLSHQRSWLPIIAVFMRHWVPAPATISQARLSAKASNLAGTFHQDPTDAHVTLSGTTFGASNPANGYALDTVALGPAIMGAIDHGHTHVSVPVKVLIPAVTKLRAQADAKQLQATLNVSVSYVYGGSSRKPPATDIAKWYQASGNTYTFNDFAIRTYIATAGMAMGVRPSNLTLAVGATKQALSTQSAATIALIPYSKAKTYQYCVQSRGADTQYLPELKNILASVYADLRGWSLDGQVAFDYATTGCDFTVWLATSDQMGTFGAICDNYWDCEVNNNVVVNLDRWLNTTPAWKSYGGSLDDYRTMLINHETGHMLGFLDNYACPAPGGPAPIMLQQSINLRGCTFNIWPTQPELTALRQMIGL